VATEVALTEESIARCKALIEKPDTLQVIFQRVSDGDNLMKLCREWEVPPGQLLMWLMDEPKRWELYLKSLEIHAHQLVAETVGIADGQGDHNRDRLRIETRFRVAKYHAPGLYADKETSGGGGVTVIVNRGSTEPPALSPDGRTLTIGE
jgi:hypothetical protein